MATDKDTIYIDIDDEITGIIDKLKASEGKIVALVLPKRASVFQSIVNMKLLKRAADDAKKHLVLITSEAGLLPLAGAAGVHVAKTLTSKPEIPAGPEAFEDADEAIDEDSGETEVTNAADGNKPVGALAGAPIGAAAAADGLETIELDDEDLPPENAPAAKDFTPPAKSKTKSAKNKKLHIPNFERFRLLLILLVLILIILIGGFIYANLHLAKATIDIKTDATNIPVSLDLGLSTSATTLSSDGSQVPAKLAQEKKTYSEQVATTGQKNNGNKATGSVTFTNCSSDGSSITIPAGTGVSANGQTYITQQTASMPTSYVGGKNKQCAAINGPFGNSSQTVSITAQNAGSSFNLPDGSQMTVAGYSSSDVEASGGASGGTDNIVQSVNQNDINNAEAKINTNDSSVKQDLTDQLQQAGYYVITATYSPGTPATTTSANVGDVASTVTVTETVTYTMQGVHQSDLQSLIQTNVQGQINTAQQSILDYGIGSATFTVSNAAATGDQITMATKAEVGPQLDTTSIKQQAEGKKAGDVQSSLTNDPDVNSVSVKFSPFWVTTVPKNADRITVNIAKPTTTKSNANASNP